MTNEIQAYQHALAVWNHFQAESKCFTFNEEALIRDAFSGSRVESFLRLLPPDERTPVAFGYYIRFAGNWSPLHQTSFLGEFLPDPSTMERRILEAASKGALTIPPRLPVTLEEFPSRIWKRALMKRSPEKLVSAACQAIDAIMWLHEPDDDDAGLEGADTILTVPSGDVHPVFDLIALTPTRLQELQCLIIDQLMDDVASKRVEFTEEAMEASRAWILMNTAEGWDCLEKLCADAREHMTQHLLDGKLYDYHHTHRLGRLLFRFGLRRLASQCAKVIGKSPGRSGWQFQAIAGLYHCRIRELILRPGSDTGAWMREPALACSAMSIPLWLMDGEERLSELTGLFNRADECPWIFPRLAHVYQWHVALAGRFDELGRIEQIAPDHAVGLSRKPELTHQ